MQVKETIIVLFIMWLSYLIAEAYRVSLSRKKIKHIIHVNGTRGKSSVTRLIYAGLKQNGYRAYCKTTGTLPMIIDCDGNERIIKRKGKANIKEQIKIICDAAKANADCLIIECMAVVPELQYAAQNSILKADIGVITNVRYDHTDVMGNSLSEIALSLCNTIPKNGILFTAEQNQIIEIQNQCKKQNCILKQVNIKDEDNTLDFPENISLAEEVCSYLGAETKISSYSRDPYALSIYRWNDCVFINGLSINDRDSICKVWKEIKTKYNFNEFVILINNRPDRGSRTKDMIEVCNILNPQKVYLMGSNIHYSKKRIKNSIEIKSIDEIKEKTIIYAIGNIAYGGKETIEKIRREGTLYV